MISSEIVGHRSILQGIARRAMIERGLLPEFSPRVESELAKINRPSEAPAESVKDLRSLPWCSIDNDDSQDLDQLTVAEQLPYGRVRIMVAISDVDSLVTSKSAIDAHARHNTTSVYTAGMVFPMLPEKLSYDFTSLVFDEDRPAIVVDMIIGADGSLVESDVSMGIVRNHAKLAYNSVAAWLDGDGPMPEAIKSVEELEENLRLQNRVAHDMRDYRHIHGALSLETIEARPVFDGDVLMRLEIQNRNSAKDIIEDFMIAANGVIARFLESKGFPSIRRIVRTPKRWYRIVELAAAHGYQLPGEPNSKALDQFLTKARADDPVRFPDVSLAVIKLMGSGEYVAEFPGESVPGHFGLAVRDYSHSTAPNRRYADLITQRLIKAALDGEPVPYSPSELESLARHCTEEEDEVRKVERQVEKSAAALLLRSRIGEQFESIVTGVTPEGTWVRLLDVPAEGKLVRGADDIDVGDHIRVQLLQVDVERGFIDFANTGRQKRWRRDTD